MHSEDCTKRPLSETESSRRERQRRQELLSRDDIAREYHLNRRWLELAALSGDGPPMVKLSRRMVRYGSVQHLSHFRHATTAPW
jgi:hypothetical protein